MFKRVFVVGVMAVMPLTACASDHRTDDRSADQAEYRTVAIPSNQGNAFTYRVPIADQAPYALTGRETQKPVRFVPVPAGQGGSVRVLLPE